MIIIDLPNTNPLINGEGLATKLEGETIPEARIINLNDVDYCQLECEYEEMTFAKVGGEWWENDKNSFLFRKLIAADTISLELWKNGVKIADITDNTYGEYYSSFTTQPLYIGLIIYWENVYNNHGSGKYYIKANKTILGTSSTFESRCFKLMPYSDKLANGTVRIETYQTGNILSSEFDYTDLLTDGWYQSYRIKGFFGFKTPKFETDNYLDQNYNIRQIQDKIINEWTLETNLVPANISNQLIYDNLLSNKFLVTDYNIMNSEIYRRVEVYPSEISEVNNYSFNRNSKFLIIFVDKLDNNIKTNY